MAPDPYWTCQSHCLRAEPGYSRVQSGPDRRVKSPRSVRLVSPPSLPSRQEWSSPQCSQIGELVSATVIRQILDRPTYGYARVSHVSQSLDVQIEGFTWTAHPDKIIAAVNRGRR